MHTLVMMEQMMELMMHTPVMMEQMMERMMHTLVMMEQMMERMMHTPVMMERMMERMMLKLLFLLMMLMMNLLLSAIECQYWLLQLLQWSYSYNLYVIEMVIRYSHFHVCFAFSCFESLVPFFELKLYFTLI